MPFCTECGHQNPDGARFCAQCGHRLVSERARRPSPTSTLNFGGPDRSRAAESAGLSEAERGGGRGAARGQRAAGRPARARAPAAGSCSTPTRSTAGRHPDSEIFLDDVTVCRRHAVFRRDVGRLSGRPTSAASTAPTSTATGSTRCCSPAATRSRSASTGSSTSPARRTVRRDARDRRPRPAPSAPRGRMSIGEVLTSCVRTSPTSASPRSASSRPRG